jgi:hypothetical protein
MNMLASRQEDQFSKVQSAIITTLSDVLRERVPNLPQWPESIEQTLQQLRDDVIAVAASKSQQPERSTLRAVTVVQSQPQDNKNFCFADVYAESCATKLAETERERWQSLSYQVMSDREDQIAEAEMKTFEWILQAPQDTQRPWSSFIEWLESGDSIYWFSGKAGSGKSTMMKFLNSHHKVQQALRTWSVDTGTSLITATFYFWYNGTTLQKTQEGLLRSLLYQALENHRELIPAVLKGSFDVATKDLEIYWTLPRLKAAFHELVAQTEVPLKICLLVDGLDEYAGEHAEIVEVFRNAAKHEHVKLCVSSRPLIVFDRAFKNAPGLMLQNLTFDDIQIYVESRFQNDERFQELELEEPGLGPNIARQVVGKASGVFLWVKLVVHSLLEGIQNFDRGVDLERRLNELPEDLTDLYWHMLNRVKPAWYLEEGFRLLQMVQRTNKPLTLLRLAFAELDRSKPSDCPSNLSVQRQDALCTSMAGRIKSRCLGLLEVVDMATADMKKRRVQFLHKSVADFLETPEMVKRMEVCFGSTGKFLPEIAIMRGISVELETTKSRMKNDHHFGQHGELKREAWFDEVLPLYNEAKRYATTVADKHPDHIDEDQRIVTKIDETISALWVDVSFRSEAERSGRAHWSEAVRKPGRTEHKENVPKTYEQRGSDESVTNDEELPLSPVPPAYYDPPQIHFTPPLAEQEVQGSKTENTPPHPNKPKCSRKKKYFTKGCRLWWTRIQRRIATRHIPRRCHRA